MKRTVLVFLFIYGLSSLIFSQEKDTEEQETDSDAGSTKFSVNWTRGPASVQPGNFLISGGFNMGNAGYSYSGYTYSGMRYSISESASMFGFTIAVDYALPKFGLTVGGETGYFGGTSWYYNFGVLPFMGRLGYHPDFGIAALDVYALAKIGFAIGTVRYGDSESSGGFGIGFGIGGRYFFGDHFGVFAELGLDGYFFNAYGVDVTGKKIFTIGITYKW
jgi:hypothetical protein